MNNEEKEKIIEQDKEKMNNIVKKSDVDKKEIKEVKILLVILVLVILGVGFYYLNNKYEFIKFGNKKEESKTEENNTQKEIEEVVDDDTIIVRNGYGKVYIKENGKNVLLLEEPTGDDAPYYSYKYNNKRLYYYYVQKKKLVINYIDVKTKKEYKNYATIDIEIYNEEHNDISEVSIIDLNDEYIYYGYYTFETVDDVIDNYTYDHVVLKYNLKTKENKKILTKEDVPFKKGIGSVSWMPFGKLYKNNLFVFVESNKHENMELYLIDNNDNVKLIDSNTGRIGGYNVNASPIYTYKNKIYYADFTSVKEYDLSTKSKKDLFQLDEEEFLAGTLTYIDKDKAITLTENKIYYYANGKAKEINLKFADDIECLDYDEEDANKKYRTCTKEEKEEIGINGGLCEPIKVEGNKIYVDLGPSTGNRIVIDLNDIKGDTYTITNKNLLKDYKTDDDEYIKIN